MTLFRSPLTNGLGFRVAFALRGMFRGQKKHKLPKGFERPKDYVPVPTTDQIVLQEQPFWTDLPDILQAQILVMLDTGRRCAACPRGHVRAGARTVRRRRRAQEKGSRLARAQRRE